MSCFLDKRVGFIGVSRVRMDRTILFHVLPTEYFFIFILLKVSSIRTNKRKTLNKSKNKAKVLEWEFTTIFSARISQSLTLNFLEEIGMPRYLSGSLPRLNLDN